MSVAPSRAAERTSSLELGRAPTSLHHRRWLAPVLLVIVAVLLSGASLDLLVSEAGLARLETWSESLGIWAAASFVLLAMPSTALGVPRSLSSFLAGALFGALHGAALAALATLGGCALSFLTVRHFDHQPRSAGATSSTRWPRLSSALRDQGFATVLGLRLVPVGHCQTLNVLLALSPVSTRAFLLGTALGILPQAVAFTLLGAGVIEGVGWTVAVGIALMLSAAWLGVWLSLHGPVGVLDQERP